MKKQELKKLIKEEIQNVLKENTSQNIINFLETNGFLKVRNKEEYLKVIPILTQAGYSLVGEKFPTKLTPFDAGYGQRRQPRKNSIYLTTYWSEDPTGKYDKFLWIADYLDKNKTSEKFPIGTPLAY
jgi:hypothetical protein